MSIDTSKEQILCLLEDIPEGKSRGFLPVRREDRVFAVRKGNQVHVYLNSCPHEWVPMDFRKDYFLSGSGEDIVLCARTLPHRAASTAGPCINQELLKVFRIETAHRYSLELPVTPRTPPQLRHDLFLLAVLTAGLNSMTTETTPTWA
jgi:nitrite reductase/ring-hydroxylating ferredoxin subunit